MVPPEVLQSDPVIKVFTLRFQAHHAYGRVGEDLPFQGLFLLCLGYGDLGCAYHPEILAYDGLYGDTVDLVDGEVGLHADSYGGACPGSEEEWGRSAFQAKLTPTNRTGTAYSGVAWVGDGCGGGWDPEEPAKIELTYQGIRVPKAPAEQGR